LSTNSAWRSGLQIHIERVNFHSARHSTPSRNDTGWRTVPSALLSAELAKSAGLFTFPSALRSKELANSAGRCATDFKLVRNRVKVLSNERVPSLKRCLGPENLSHPSCTSTMEEPKPRQAGFVDSWAARLIGQAIQLHGSDHPQN
jgi:hypothetical protein